MHAARRALAVAVVAAVALVGMAVPALADGSATLYPTDATCAPNSADGGCRAYIEWRSQLYGPTDAGGAIRRRTVFSVLAKQGEDILLGSSAVGVGAGDIIMFDPGVVTDESAEPLPAVTPGTNGFTCSASGPRAVMRRRA